MWQKPVVHPYGMHAPRSACELRDSRGRTWACACGLLVGISLWILSGKEPLQTQREQRKQNVEGTFMRTCALVSSAGSLLRSNLGAEIDKHDYIIRIGVAPTIGHEADVGTRTHARFLSAAFFEEARRSNVSQLRHVVDNEPALEAMIFICPNVVDGGENAWRPAMEAFASKRKRPLGCKWVTQASSCPLYTKRGMVATHVSTGVLAVEVAFRRQHCDSVQLFGFAHNNGSHTAPYHYWTDGSLMDGVSEYAWLNPAG